MKANASTETTNPSNIVTINSSINVAPSSRKLSSRIHGALTTSTCSTISPLVSSTWSVMS